MFVNDLLAKKNILITGGGSGLGKEMARRFLSLGANVIICGRREETLQNTIKEISRNEGDIIGIPCDVRDNNQVENLIESSYKKIGKIDVLVNNAAGNFISPTKDLSVNAFKVVIDIVLQGTINCTLTLGKKWIEEKSGGCVLNILTTYATNGSNYVVPSACAKAGVQTLTRSLAVEWGEYNIRMCGIAPGGFPTKGAFSRLLPDEKLLNIGLERNPKKRYGNPEELCDLAAYLISDYADYINGEIVTIDGGHGLSLGGVFNFLGTLTDDEWKTIRKQVRKKKL